MLEPYLRVRDWLRSEEGQDMIEYVLLVVLIALVVIVAIPTLSNAIRRVLARIAGTIIVSTDKPPNVYPWPWWPWSWPWPWPWW